MVATLTTVNNILKEVYEKQIQDQLQSETVAMKRIEKSAEGIQQDVGGKYVVFPTRNARNAGIGARLENEALPVAGQQGYGAARVGLKYLYGGVQLSGPTIELADKNYQAFASALQMEMDGLKEDLAKDQNRQYWGTNNGILANITADGVNTVTVTNSQYLEVGQMVDVVDGTTFGNPTPTVKFTNRQITAINTVTNIVTYNGADGTAVAGDKICRVGSANREMTGLSQIVLNTGVLFNIDSSVDTTWQSTVDSNGGTLRALSEGLMVLQVDKARFKGGKTSVILCDLGVRRSYFNLLVQQRRFTNTTTFEGGFAGLAFTTDRGDIPVVVDMDTPNNQMFFLDESRITVYREADWSWMDRDGSIWQRVNGFDAYFATLFTYTDLATHKRNAHAVMVDLTES